ncbi:hypothetical protein [Hathewaya massiliensis]|uniref:hypothetical protein n=1 Tax=Hathewaya massiliensis TaxID=1964382 RepID=UPI00115A1A9F|nr:hypothetical protein [Hathewaya massiliensis]
MNKGISRTKYIGQVFMQDFFRTKLVVLMILQFFVLHIVLSPIRKFTQTANYPISPWVIPIVFINLYFHFLFMACVIYHYSNVPFMQRSQMYQIIRSGKRKWALGKIVGIILGGFGLAIMESLLSLLPLIGRLRFETNWGKVIYSLAMTNAAEEYKIPFYFPYELLNSYSPLKAMLIFILVSGLVISFIGVTMFAVSILFSRLAAIVTAMILIILPFVEMNLKRMYDWLIYVSPVSWMNMTKIGVRSEGKLPTLSYIIPVLLTMIIILSLVIIWRIKTIDFQWNKEEQ